MKKYILIKEYPGSPCIPFTTQPGDLGYQPSYYQKYPEFWQEITKPEYTILELLYNKTIYTLDPNDNLYKYQIGYISMEPTGGFYTLKDVRINKVRRESDGEVFTIGDKLDGFDLGRPVDLTMFKFDKDKLLIGLRDLGMYNINSIKHAKQPLVLFGNIKKNYPKENKN